MKFYSKFRKPILCFMIALVFINKNAYFWALKAMASLCLNRPLSLKKLKANMKTFYYLPNSIFCG